MSDAHRGPHQFGEAQCPVGGLRLDERWPRRGVEARRGIPMIEVGVDQVGDGAIVLAVQIGQATVRSVGLQNSEKARVVDVFVGVGHVDLE